MRKFKTVWLSLLFLSGSHILFAQWTTFDTGNSNLPDNSVRVITIDQFGRKWVGTDFGLAVVADTGWTIFQTSDGLPDNAVRCISIDKQGTVWIGTETGGLAKYDGTNWTTYNFMNSGLSTDNVQAVAFDTSGNKWIGTQSGLDFFNDTTWADSTMLNSILASDNIKSIVVDDSNMVYIGTLNGGYVTIRDTVWTLYTIATPIPVPDNTILSIAIDGNGRKWLATPANGLAYNINNFFYNYTPINSLIQSFGFYSVTIDSLDNVYSGSIGSGLIKKSGLFFYQYSTLNSGIPDDYILSIAIESNGIIWLGTATHGLVRLDESLITGIYAAQEISSGFVFPNPAKEKIMVSGLSNQVRKLQLSTVSGDVVMDLIKSDLRETVVLDLSSLTAGVYFLRILSDDKMVVKKIIKVN